MSISINERLSERVYSLLESKLEILQEIEELKRDMAVAENQPMIESEPDSVVNWSYMLADLHTVVNQIDVNTVFSFIDDIEEQVNDLPYKVRLAKQKMRTAVNPIFRNTPVFFDASNPPAPEDFKETIS